jgi:hypothetical protein
MVAARALFYLLLWCSFGMLGPMAAAQQILPACSQLLSLRIRSSHQNVAPGGKVLLTAKVVNKGSTPVSGLNVRMDLPTGLVAMDKHSQEPLITDGGATSYWVGLTLRPGKKRLLKLKAKACATATPGSFPVDGAVYLTNSTDAVTCLSPAARTPQQVCFELMHWSCGT